MQVINYGAVFTKRWMVEMILDLAGYVADRDLSAMTAIEPSCGNGSFLMPMIDRLSVSCKSHGREILEARNAIRAFDLQQQNVLESKLAIESLLISKGWPIADVQTLISYWIKEADYLLENHTSIKADFIIGNPPYIRAQSMSSDQQIAYMKNCKTMTEGTDIYVGFIEVGLKSLKPEGVLAFICADRWMRNAYGKRLRKLVTSCYAVDIVLEMHGVNAFAEEVSAYPAVTILRNGKQGSVAIALAKPEFNANSVPVLTDWIKNGTFVSLNLPSISVARLQDWFRGDSFWPIGSPDRLAFIDDLEKRFSSLEDGFTGTKVGIGIATGADKVFIVKDKSLVEPDRLLPLATTSHIKTGIINWSDTWLMNPWDNNGSLVNLEQYPLMKKYLESVESSLKKRHVANKNPSKWYRTIDKVNSNLISRPKLLFQDINASIQPVYDPGGLYPHHNLYWVTSDSWDLEVLGGLLLSRVAQMFVECYGVRMRGGTLRFQSQYLRRICVPNPDDLSESLKARLIQAFRCRDVELATNAAMQAYGIEEMPC